MEASPVGGDGLVGSSPIAPKEGTGAGDLAAAREEYEATRLTGVRRGAVIYSFLGVTLFLAVALLDPIRYPDRTRQLLLVRLVTAGVLAGVLALLLGPMGRRHPHALGLVAPTVTGAALRALELEVQGGVTPFDIGTVFAVLGIPFLMPWAAGWSALACLHIVGSHLVTPFLGVPLGPGFTQDLGVFGATAGVSVLLATVFERRRFADFLRERTVVEAHREAHRLATQYGSAVDALRESEARLRTVIDNSPVVLFALDRAGTITFSGGRGLSRLAVVPDGIVGQRIADVLRERFAHVEGNFARAFAGDEVTWQGTIGGAVFETRLTPVRDAEGAVTGVIGLATDVSDRREAEETRLALARKLAEAKRLESLGLLAGGIAHDFNNLLGTVLGNASLVLPTVAVGSPARVSLERIEQAVRHGSDLTRQLLAYAGEGEVTPEPVDLNAIVRETRDLLEVSLPPTITVALALDAKLPAFRADPTQLHQVMMNLVLNAAEAIRAGRGTISVRTGVTDLDIDALRAAHAAPDAVPGRYVFLEVRDDGCGMHAATQAQIFEPFFSTKRSGRGLGLAGVLGIVRGHRGALTVASEPGRGTTFRILLPRGEEVATPVAACPQVAPAPAAEVSLSRTVLLVDDEEDVRAVTAHMLERLGCAVLTAGDGQEGVKVFQRNAEVIDAVVIDLTLPRLSGDRAAAEMRRIRPDAPVILMSGRSDEALRAHVPPAASVGFLRKPFSAADLRLMMDTVLTEARR